MTAYKDSRREASELSLDTWPVAPALLTLLSETGTFEGRASDLLDELQSRSSDAPKLMRSWPKLPHQLSAQLTRHAPSLRSDGWEVSRTRSGRTGERLIRISRQFPVSSVSTVSNGSSNSSVGHRAGGSDLAGKSSTTPLTLADATKAYMPSVGHRTQAGTVLPVADATDTPPSSLGRRRRGEGIREASATLPPAAECRCGAFNWSGHGGVWHCQACGSTPWYDSPRG
jgi:hypothetical protein